ncbi:MAG: tRNA (cytidine(34)-2'-O)-methyltransferase [Deltaproteobacteria bacterium]|nr:tRNA (cytidine(34)-2'-O)-methyltransferase [Deltaproteobacteria bacterium]
MASGVDKDGLPRLRAAPLPLPLHIVLVEPEIPQNTGSIARLAAATGCVLHLVGKLGFRIDAKAVRRAGLDYWPLVTVQPHESWAEFRGALPHARLRLLSAVASRSYLEAAFQGGDALVFGRESTGLPGELLARHAADTFAVPTIGRVRSLNLSTVVGIVLYEALRQLGAFEKLRLE